ISQASASNVSIKNFGQMDDRFFRGGQPKKDEYQELAALGIKTVIDLRDDPSTGNFYVHCAGGRHRTGVAGAVYRFNHYNWTYDQVYAEMKKYDFYTRFGHGDMKKFVQDYATSFQSKSQQIT